MTKQERLTDGELASAMDARSLLRRIVRFSANRTILENAIVVLNAMAHYATTDGQPWVDPEPPIPDGYRLAAAGDEGRRDVKFWSPIASEWQGRPFPDTSFTSGDRYIVPIVPPIPDGYRLAAAGDEGRRDRKYWAETLTKWVPAICMPYRTDLVFIVPIDRTPTDEEAKSRPEVMVRDCDDQKWHKHILVMVRGCEHSKYKFAATDTERAVITC